MHYSKTISAADKIGKGANAKQTVLNELTVASSADGNLVVTDGTKSLTFYVALGSNHFCCDIPWAPDCDLTLTPSAAMTVIAEYTQK